MLDLIFNIYDFLSFNNNKNNLPVINLPYVI